MRQRILVLIFYLFVAGPAFAGYADNYNAWSRLSLNAQQLYISGGIDFYKNFVFDSARDRVIGVSVLFCMKDHNLNHATLTQHITDTYRAHHKVWNAPVPMMMQYLIVRFCEREINEVLRKQNISPPVSANAIWEDMLRRRVH
jgi:hypothetical protein